ncbi:MAG: hypothetical protein JRJ20_15990 [Deltaproteobacteria bacterium]|nr:hypothetical protein [Deltaproteobacteria bacterium]
MIWLQSNEKFDSLAEYDPETGMLKKHSRKNLGSNVPETTDGFYSELTNGVFILYRFNDSLYFRANDNDFILDSVTEVVVSGPWENRELKVFCDGKMIFETIYSPHGPKPISNDPTPFIEDEDFDFGIFVSNISKSPKRKDLLLGRG